MPTVPSSLALTVIQAGSQILSADHRNNYSAIQTGVNGLETCLTGGAANQILRATSSTAVDWSGGTYTDFTPSWTSSGSAPAIGNGTLAGRYTQMGKLVHYFGQLTTGSTTTFGTGNYSISLPVNRSTSGSGAINRAHGVVELFDQSAASGGIALPDTTAAVSAFQIAYGATYLGVRTLVAATTPWTWAINGDYIYWNLIYEGA